MNELTVFHKIVTGDIPARVVWEDADHMAFLTPFPNTPGITIVIPKKYPGDYVFSMEDIAYQLLMDASKKVANILEKAFATSRIALAFDGTGVGYVHARLIPLHGDLNEATAKWDKHIEFFPEFAGYFTTTDGPRMSDTELDEIQEKIRRFV